MTIGIKASNDPFFNDFDGDEYLVTLGISKDYCYKTGDIICQVCPWGINLPQLRLEIAIRDDGSIHLRNWDMQGNGNTYVHTLPYQAEDIKPTVDQIEAVNGLWSGRIRFNGLRLHIGGTLQQICPINVSREEHLLQHKIYLS